MPKIAGVNHRRAVRALEKAGFRVIREGKHIVMSNGVLTVSVPRNNPVNAYTMGAVSSAIGLSVGEFKKLL